MIFALSWLITKIKVRKCRDSAIIPVLTVPFIYLSQKKQYLRNKTHSHKTRA